MLQVRCQKCGWSFTLGRDTITTIMDEVKESKTTHYRMDCPKCRQGIKVQTRQLQRYLRPQAASESADEGAK